jgi:hypothetical protein
VITCLMDDSSVLENVTGEDGILAGMRRDTIHIGASTITPKGSTDCLNSILRMGAITLLPPWRDILIMRLPGSFSVSRRESLR